MNPQQNPLYAATCPTGLEKVLERELRKLSVFTTRVENRLVFFEADEAGMVRINMAVRTAQRIWRVMASDPTCDHFDRLFDLAHAVAWEKFLSADMPVRVHGSSQSSTLESVPTIQRLIRRAIGNRLGSEPGDETTEDAADVLGLMLRNEAFVLLDTSGAPLHKRGYRPKAGEAPIKETLAAGLILLSEWDSSISFVDPFGGSGTIAIEAALIGLDIAPNTTRPFAFEKFRGHDPAVFVQERAKLDAAVRKDLLLTIRCMDTDPAMAGIALDNIHRAGLARHISVETAPFPRSMADIPVPFHCVTNPPYGNRLKSEGLPELYRDLSAMFRRP
jgi:putative N6-adenine-specific DNA methylase